MTDSGKLRWFRVDDIPMGSIQSITYDKTTDIITVTYEGRDGSLVNKHYGPKASNIGELVTHLQEFWNLKHEETEREFEEIYARIDVAQDEGLS